MAESSLIEKIISAIKNATSLTPHVRGGNAKTPIEYVYSRVGVNRYTLQIYITAKDIKASDSLASTIIDTITDFADYSKFSNCSITLTGGGNTLHNTDTIQALYFTVIDYTKKGQV